jgi:hypothetical protein
MAFPKIIILAQGGTHGDFLYQSCKIITSDADANEIDSNGRVIESSIFKRKNLNVFGNGQKMDTMSNYLHEAQPIEVCHVWYEEFIDWPSKFYYINYDDSLLEIIKKMYFEKVHNNDKTLAMIWYKKHLPDSVARKINHDNLDKVINSSYRNAQKKYKKQPNAKAINIVDLYSIDKLISIMKDMEIYQEKNLSSLKTFHSEWLLQNDKWIKQIEKIGQSNK